MRFSIGGTFAKCAGCGGDDFFPALAISSGRRGVYICARCGNESEYTELVRRGKEAIGRAEGKPSDPSEDRT
jgi:hypothetical protein